MAGFTTVGISVKGAIAIAGYGNSWRGIKPKVAAGKEGRRHADRDSGPADLVWRRAAATGAFKSYHTDTPNGYNLQISYVTHDNRLALPNAVKPSPSGRPLTQTAETHRARLSAERRWRTCRLALRGS